MEVENVTTPAQAEAVAPQELEQEVTEELEVSDSEGDENSEQEQAQADEQEVEFKGSKYRVPAALADVIAQAENMERHFTKTNQTNAEIRRAAEAELETARRERQINEELIDDVAQMRFVESQLEQFRQINWAQVPPQEAQQILIRQMQFNQAREELSNRIEGRRSELEANYERQRATVLSQAIEQLNKPDPDKGWAGKFDRDTQASLTNFGHQQLGFSAEELAGTTDARMIKTLNLAKIGYEALKKQRAAAVKPAIEAKPVPQVGQGRSSPVIKGLDDRLPADEWVKRREAQLRKKA